MRIAIVSREYPPVTNYSGGIGSQYGRLAPALARLEHDVHVFTLAPSGSGHASALLDGVNVHTLAPPRAWPWHEALYARRVSPALAAHGPFDTVLAAEFAGEACHYAARPVAGPLATHLLTSSAQLLATRPGLSWRERHGLHTRIVLALERAQAARSTALSAPSDRVLEWARELWPEIARIPTRRLPLTVEVAAISAGVPPDRFPRDVPTIVLASRLDGHKGGQLLIAALERLPADTHVVFVGREGTWNGRPIREHLTQLAGSRIERVRFLGAQPPDAYFGAVAAATVVAIPSYWESFCLAAVEAMSLRRPLVATRGHGFDAFARDGENALLVDRGDIEALTAALARLLADEDLRRRLGDEGRRTAEAHDAAAVAPLYADWLAGVSRDAISSSSSGPRLRRS